ncbi:hypothetical protein DESAMIL20_662 [Desulfurella amilsii]|jgi:heme/copper-type cytochrome/quinol oxidase subunit 2|uniref:Uncharacterized protein n=1 Tax=Desulfurella amilsii TaxID=1562698 RepID=A0A1X4XY75_9BACT|nr:hypothetical protein [Desulfurella amilsii]OSS42478.1 hypothetical protein DESAMIL20_662 [Desulfurella amilsii]
MMQLTSGHLIALTALLLFVLFLFIGNFYVVKFMREVLHNTELSGKQKIKWLAVLAIPIVGLIIYFIWKVKIEFKRQLAEEETQNG